MNAELKMEVFCESDEENPFHDIHMGRIKFRNPPVIVGSGPSGLFSALIFAEAGCRSIILERGEQVEKRIMSVKRFQNEGVFSARGNFCFGEGGAGTFSDGKLTCGKNSPLIRYIFKQLVRFGAPSDILYDAHPHIGSDNLIIVVKNIRRYLEERGTRFLFEKTFTGFRKGGEREHLVVEIDDGSLINTDHILLAIGHSARDTYRMLHSMGMYMTPKPFAVGVRIEHPQELINKIQYGKHMNLPPAEYKLTAKSGERGVWSFCMCPGGILLPTNSREGHLSINGMSRFKRDTPYANAAIVVNVKKNDFFGGSPLDGLCFQEEIERRVFAAGGGNYMMPAQRLTDFMDGKRSNGKIDASYLPGVKSARVDLLLPDFITRSISESIGVFNRKMNGFMCREAVVLGAETKTSSAVVINRNEDFESISNKGIYPIGEGAGYAGGIVSAALDGIKTSRGILSQLVDG
ncbi:MAG: hypothetical protein HQK54_06785 [Oligoflexales bacterium]|nr:hypothetical protein [Oligoflexales bacterium]